MSESPALSFQVTAQCSKSSARAGVVTTTRGTIETPVFMPVGTKATVKAMTPEELETIGAQIILSNTFHLALRPGHEIVRALGGLHKMMHWNRPVLTDSGGFQVWSLASLRKMDEHGVRFQSPLDGSLVEFTPERSIEIQQALGADIIMVFDECTPYPSTLQEAQRSAERTARWAQRCRNVHQDGDGGQTLFGIVQGGVHPQLREWSARATIDIGFAGYAIGGLSVGETKPEMEESLEACDAVLPKDQPRYLMGVGTPADFFRGVERGVDMFDCVLPSRSARTGRLYTAEGVINIRNSQHTKSLEPISASCTCYACQHYSRGYLRHLFQCDEILASRLATTHNLAYFLNLMAGIRSAIAQDRFLDYKREALAAYAGREGA